MYTYAEIAAKDVDQETRRRAHMVLATIAREHLIKASVSTIRWFVAKDPDGPQLLGRQEDSVAWTVFEHLSHFTDERALDGLCKSSTCKSSTEVWVRGDLAESRTLEVVAHEALHMAARQLGYCGLPRDDDERITDQCAKDFMARFDWEQAEQDYVDWLVDPERWIRQDAAAKAKAQKPAKAAKAAKAATAKKPTPSQRKTVDEILAKARARKAAGRGGAR